MQCRLLLDIVVGESAAVFELLAREDQALLVWGNSFLVLNLGLDIVYLSSQLLKPFFSYFIWSVCICALCGAVA